MSFDVGEPGMHTEWGLMGEKLELKFLQARVDSTGQLAQANGWQNWQSVAQSVGAEVGTGRVFGRDPANCLFCGWHMLRSAGGVQSPRKDRRPSGGAP